MPTTHYVIYSLCKAICYLALIFYSIKTFLLYTSEFKRIKSLNVPKIKTASIIPIAYSVFSVIYIFLLILNMNSIELKILALLNEIKISSFEVIPTPSAFLITSILTFLLLSAFIVNFSKSFYTFNSLDFSYLNKSYIKIKRNHLIWESVHRFINVCMFICLEITISKLSFEKIIYKHFYNMGLIGVFLFISLRIWVYFLKKDQNGNVPNIKWWNYQLYASVGISLFLLLLGKFSLENQIIFILCAIIFILCILYLLVYIIQDVFRNIFSSVLYLFTNNS